MNRPTLSRTFLAAIVACLCTSFVVVEVPSSGPSLPTASDTYRVSRRYAAGLEYLLVEPRELPEDAELPMVVYLHGRSSIPTPPDGPFYDLETPVRVILPRGPDRSGHGYAWMPVSAAHGERPELVGPLTERARMIAEAMVEWRRRHPTRGLPIVLGFSQGGMLAMELATHHASSISEAIALAGWLPPSRMPTAPYDPYTRGVPIHALHGGADPVLGATRTQATVERLRALGYPAAFEVFPGVRHEVDVGMRERAEVVLREAIERLPDSDANAGQS